MFIAADVRFEAHYGLKPDIAPSPKTSTTTEVGGPYRSIPGGCES